MTGSGGPPVQGSKYSSDDNHYRSSPPGRDPPPCNSQKNYQNNESVEKCNWSGLLNARLNSAGSTADVFHLTTGKDLMFFWLGPQSSNPSVQGEMMEGAKNQGAREQDRPVR